MERLTPRTFATRILARRPLSAKAFELVLARPEGFRFAAGQRIGLRLDDAERDYSLASAPADPEIRLCIRGVAGGAVSPQLEHAPIGTPLSFEGPHGYFAFAPSARPPVFVATGTGVAPFRAMAAAGAGGYILLHGVDAPEELYYAELLRARAAAYVPCIPHAGTTAPGVFAGRVTDYLAGRLAPGAFDFYACGRRDMVRDVTLLADERFPGSLLLSETFY
jgi:benzoate/toluate 1,2-dioxygenase reductase component